MSSLDCIQCCLHVHESFYTRAPSDLRMKIYCWSQNRASLKDTHDNRSFCLIWLISLWFIVQPKGYPLCFSPESQNLCGSRILASGGGEYEGSSPSPHYSDGTVRGSTIFYRPLYSLLAQLGAAGESDYTTCCHQPALLVTDSERDGEFQNSSSNLYMVSTGYCGRFNQSGRGRFFYQRNNTAEMLWWRKQKQKVQIIKKNHPLHPPS